MNQDLIQVSGHLMDIYSRGTTDHKFIDILHCISGKIHDFMPPRSSE